MTSIILITGATSGIGAAAARRFVGAGHKVIATGRRQARLDALVAELGEENVHAITLDMRDEAAIHGAVAEIPESFRNVDILLNNAGLARGMEPAQDADLGKWREMIETNVLGLVTITHALLPTLIARRGAIINLSSIAGTYPYRFGNVYGGTKAFVTQFSLNLRCDLQGTGVRVTSIEPGMVETEFTVVRTGGDQQVSDELYRDMDPLTADDIAETIFWVATQPPHVNLNRIEIMPVNQSFAGFAIARNTPTA
ncbi:SDR family NAD(P)-dependent oxidoreductase [Allosphingosinicella deserti]|uniref:NADP-dependent 3-hydroxy acid dehydrogenase n=1 Tax=Allosphingosinicella deserti TaxID=2116704 RepID=A0A2P7QV47_9SPHN|nr:SDR family NAD(P)-dependent oxidoreductase [Sphingomonas deserti]PSJ41842.1 NADP-dependent 3-hydroxy acid dehydrogenase [Sphingomonas deserti]